MEQQPHWSLLVLQEALQSQHNSWIVYYRDFVRPFSVACFSSGNGSAYHNNKCSLISRLRHTLHWLICQTRAEAGALSVHYTLVQSQCYAYLFLRAHHLKRFHPKPLSNGCRMIQATGGVRIYASWWQSPKGWPRTLGIKPRTFWLW